MRVSRVLLLLCLVVGLPAVGIAARSHVREVRASLESAYTVLMTVAGQYLIELGEETLLHLRSPDQNIRAMATGAVERLSFYAEAKKAFKD